jgi:hypothetical protein
MYSIYTGREAQWINTKQYNHSTQFYSPSWYQSQNSIHFFAAHPPSKLTSTPPRRPRLATLRTMNISKTFSVGPLTQWRSFMVIPTSVCLVLAPLVHAFIHDLFLGLANLIHASSLTISTPSTSASALPYGALTMSSSSSKAHPRAPTTWRLLCGFLHIGNLD